MTEAGGRLERLMPASRRRRGRLRNRIVLRIGLLVAGLSLVVGTFTYYIVRDALLDEHRRSASEQFTTNAAVLSDALRGSDVDEVALLASLRPDVRARELLLSEGEWFSASLQVQPSDLPDGLVSDVVAGRPSSQRFELDGRLVVVLGAPISSSDHYFEVFSLHGVRRTLGTLRTTLIVVGLTATVIGMVIAGWIARRIARPLERVSMASAEIAGGDLGIRLSDHDDDEEIARIAESFNQMTDSLVERIQREARFAADVSHELRSPLTTLVNTVTVLERRRQELSPDAQEALTLLAGDVARFERMVADLIEISKHDAGSVRFEFDEVSPGHAVTSALRRAGQHVPVVVDGDASDALISVDSQRFERVLGNVLENATSYGGGPTRISVDADTTHVQIAIDDAGPGIGAHERERIFERFARGEHGERRNTADGSGLGLALAHENMARHGGTIRVTTPPDGTGARFILTFPRVDAGPREDR